MNGYLDEIANLRAYANKNNKSTAHHNHEWRKAASQEGNNSGNNNNSNNGEKQTDATLRADWLRRVMSNGLSPLEHKWLVRILQKKVRNLEKHSLG